MNQVLIVAYGVTITPWKLIGYLGVLLFAGRWVVRSKRHSKARQAGATYKRTLKDLLA